jgi:hypothetical protein
VEQRTPPPFHIYGKDYGSDSAETRHVMLGSFGFQRGERFRYVYNYDAHWQCDIRLEATLPCDPQRFSPICTAGQRPAPPEHVQDAQTYLELLDAHRFPPLDALRVLADAAQVVLDAPADVSIREAVGDLDAIREAMDRLDLYQQLQPGALRDVACVERGELTPRQPWLIDCRQQDHPPGHPRIVVEWQMRAYLAQQRHCPQYGTLRHRKGVHHTVLRTVFGDVPVESPRFTHCPCQAHATESFSPLADLLPERTTPELLYLETKWATLASYGTSVKLLQDVLPCDEPLEPVTIRNHVCTLAQRLEDELGDEQVSFIEGCPRDWGELPTPDGPLTVGIDGGYVKAQGAEQGWFEVIAGKSLPRSSVGKKPRSPSLASVLPSSRPTIRNPNAGCSSCSNPGGSR